MIDNQEDPPPISEHRVVTKIRSALNLVSEEAVTHALMLYYTLRAPETPLWCRTVIIGALGYFISIIDGIPDLTPFLGYTDDISVMAAAVATLATHITPEIKAKAKCKAKQLLGKESQPRK